jgi:TolB protein
MPRSDLRKFNCRDIAYSYPYGRKVVGAPGMARLGLTIRFRRPTFPGNGRGGVLIVRKRIVGSISLSPYSFGCILAFLLSPTCLLRAQTAAPALGLFQNHADIGSVLHAGSAQYDPAHNLYSLTGSGENMWFMSDAFQFAWKQVTGDIALTADVAFPEKGGNPHRKAVLMIRQSLDADALYSDVTLHGDGLTSLQFREAKGSTTHEIQSNLSAPHRLRIERRGDFIYVFLAAAAGEPLRPSGAAIRLPLQGSFYVGIGVCSHDKDVVEKAVFSNVDLATPAASAAPPVLYSTLETVAIASADRRVLYGSASHFEAPNWSHDGTYLIFNQEGHILRLPAAGGMPTTIDTGAATHCNNDHGISPDSTLLAISDQSQPDHQSSVYVVPIGGGAPRRVTENSPSYWHGWSPDGKTLAFVGRRNDDFDIYTIPVAGGDETRLTTAKGLDDGPEYSPDGKYIYFNSERTGHMQIWRMRADGSAQEQVTFDDFNNWFPHLSPDSMWMVFLSYGNDVTGHPPNKDVQLRVMNVSDGKIGVNITVLAKLFGGQGTINVPSWSPDSLKVAFVSYELLPDEEAEIK